MNDSYSLDENTTLTVIAANGVLANDGDVDGDPLTAKLVSGPVHGGLTLNPDGTFSYKPNANYHGSDSFTYKANDGVLLSTLATAQFTVNPVSAPPAAAGNSSHTNAVTTVNVAANDVVKKVTTPTGSTAVEGGREEPGVKNPLFTWVPSPLVAKTAIADSDPNGRDGGEWSGIRMDGLEAAVQSRFMKPLKSANPGWVRKFIDNKPQHREVLGPNAAITIALPAKAEACHSL